MTRFLFPNQLHSSSTCRSIRSVFLLHLLLLFNACTWMIAVESTSIEYESSVGTNHSSSDSFEYENDLDLDADVDDEAYYNDGNPPFESEGQSTSTTMPDDPTLNDADDIDPSAYEDEHQDDHIYADTMSVNRFQSKGPIVDAPERPPSYSTSSTVVSTELLPSYLWPQFFSKPAIVVGIVGSVVVGLLAGIVLVMFFIYRVRKKDEGSYVLDEGPIKSPSHAYTRVSSREFFA